MKIRLTTPEDYTELVTWWKFWRFPAPSIDMLPNNAKDGVMVYNGEQNICAGFIYRSPSSICFCEYIVSNPKVKDKAVRKDALILSIESISELAANMGFKTIITIVNNENLINKYLDCGYVKGSKSFEMIKVL